MTSQRTRERLIRRLGQEGIRNRRVLESMRNTPRHLFVDEALASLQAIGAAAMSAGPPDELGLKRLRFGVLMALPGLEPMQRLEAWQVLALGTAIDGLYERRYLAFTETLLSVASDHVLLELLPEDIPSPRIPRILTGLLPGLSNVYAAEFGEVDPRINSSLAAVLDVMKYLQAGSAQPDRILALRQEVADAVAQFTLLIPDMRYYYEQPVRDGIARVDPTVGFAEAETRPEQARALRKVLLDTTDAWCLTRLLAPDISGDRLGCSPDELEALRTEVLVWRSEGARVPRWSQSISRRLELDPAAKTALADSMRHVEERLEASRSQLQGLSIELDNLRRLHRQILQDLPLGVCAIDNQGKIVLWNLALEVMSGVEAQRLIGTGLNDLPRPWDGLLSGFSRSDQAHIYRMELPVAGRPRWYNLHKAAYADPVIEGAGPSRPGVVMLIEDLTDLGNLEAELAHSDRLASVGRLAAGVAHEIGNPVTGIASLAQNLRHEVDPDIVRQSVEDIIDQTLRISSILGNLKSFSRGSRHLQQRETFALCEAVNDAVHLLHLANEHEGIRFEASCPGDIVLTGTPSGVGPIVPGDRVEVEVEGVGVLMNPVVEA
mgnify:CR=1 FL=1